MAAHEVDPPLHSWIDLRAAIPGGPKAHRKFGAIGERGMAKQLRDLVVDRFSFRECLGCPLELAQDVFSCLLLFGR
jgi:hypothetical protein